VSKIVVSADGATVLGSVEGTVFKRTPASGEWIAAGSGLRGGTVTSLCIDEGDPRVMYATTPAGMFRGSLEGGTWEAFARVLPSPPTIVVSHPWYKNRLFAAGDHGIFVSTNSGKSWSQTRPVDLRHTVNGFTFTPTNAGLVHAATDDVGVLQSTNGGIAWEERRYGLTADKIITVTLDDDDPRTLYAWTGKGECYRSTNLGTEWDRYAVPWHEGRQVLVAMEKNKPSSVVALVDGRDIYYAHSGGGTWRLLLQRGPTFRASTILWNEATKTMYLGTADSGVFMIDLGPAFQEEPDQEE
jgi:photosystem II stability/assembly factor-like uncharacterized protein